MPIVVANQGTTWFYRFSQQAPSPEWSQLGAEETAIWDEGFGLFGWGDRFVDTLIDVPAAQRPLATYFVLDFDINPAEFADTHQVVRLVIRADDGAVVYLNGQEIGRQGIGDGVVTHGTYANRAIKSVDAGIDPLIIEIPLQDLIDGTNRIAVQTHVNYRSTPTMTFKADVEIR